MKKLIMGLAAASLILAPAAQADDTDVLPDLDHLTATPWEPLTPWVGLHSPDVERPVAVPESLFQPTADMVYLPGEVYPDFFNLHWH
jgi:hypothetical protein